MWRRSNTATFDFQLRQVVYVVRDAVHKPDYIRLKVERMQAHLQAQGLQVVVEGRRGKVKLTITGPAVKHLFNALPMFGMKVESNAVVDAYREAHDEALGETTTIWMRDIDQLAYNLCNESLGTFLPGGGSNTEGSIGHE
jgi:hypothetical protein